MAKNQDATDHELILQIAAGDEYALGELYLRHGGHCLTRAVRVLRNRTLAEDAVQEAFLDLWRTAARFDERRASVAAWLLVLVHRRAVDLARREARRSALHASLPASTDLSYTAEEELLLLVDRRRMRAAIGQLNRQQRELVELAYYGGLTHRELACRLGVPIGTIKSRMSAAIAQLSLAFA